MNHFYEGSFTHGVHFDKNGNLKKVEYYDRENGGVVTDNYVDRTCAGGTGRSKKNISNREA